MKCEDVLARIDDYLDGALPEAEFQELELHLAGCEACQREARGLSTLLSEAAALPREKQPSRDLWPGIAERLAEAKPARPVFGWGQSRVSGLQVLVAAAAVIVAVSVWLRPRPPGPTSPDGTLQPAALGDAPDSVRQAEIEYIRATGQLMAALNERREQLAPEARAAVDQNLKAVDDGLRQVRDELRKDPQNQKLAHMLSQTQQKKLDLLLRLIRLTSQL